jgi:hypothetical protein
MVDLVEQLKTGPRSQRRSAAMQLSDSKVRGALKPLEQMAKGGFFWKGTPYLSSPGYFRVKDQEAALDAIASYEGCAQAAALEILRTYVGECDVKVKRAKPKTKGSSVYKVSCKVTFPQLGRLGKKAYLLYTLDHYAGTDSRFSDESAASVKAAVKQRVEDPNFRPLSSQDDITLSDRCKRLYERIERLEKTQAS